MVTKDLWPELLCTQSSLSQPVHWIFISFSSKWHCTAVLSFPGINIWHEMPSAFIRDRSWLSDLTSHWLWKVHVSMLFLAEKANPGNSNQEGWWHSKMVHVTHTIVLICQKVRLVLFHFCFWVRFWISQ